jgi:hypothetical protein
MTSELDKVYTALNNWRDNRTNQGRPPQFLKQQILALTTQHKSEELSKHLGVQLKTLERWLKPSPSKKEIHFVPLALEPEPSKSSAPRQTPLCLTIELNNGVRLSLSGQRTAELIEFTRALAKELTA